MGVVNMLTYAWIELEYISTHVHVCTCVWDYIFLGNIGSYDKILTLSIIVEGVGCARFQKCKWLI